MNTVVPFSNTGPECAEHHGGNCPDPDTCVYRNDDSAVLGDPYQDEWLADWAPVDYRAIEHENAYRAGRFVGFCTGVLAVLAGVFALQVIDWLVS